MIASSWATDQNKDYWAGRTEDLYGKADAGAVGELCIFGDSITEFIQWMQIGGQPFVNCGFASAGVIDLNNGVCAASSAGPAALSLLKPSAAIIMIGINDSHVPGINNTLPLWQANGSALITSWVGSYVGLIGDIYGNYTQKIVLATILPPENGYADDVPDRLPVIQMQNQKLVQIAAYFKIPIIDTYAAFAGPDGTAASGNTFDGIHPSAQGYAVLKPLYDSAFAQ